MWCMPPGDWSLLPALVPGDVLFREVRVFRAHNVCVFSVRQFGIRFLFLRLYELLQHLG